MGVCAAKAALALDCQAGKVKSIISPFGAGVSWGIYFAAYNRAKARYQRRSGAAKLGPQMHLAAAAEAGALVSVCACPQLRLCTILQGLNRSPVIDQHALLQPEHR